MNSLLSYSDTSKFSVSSWQRLFLKSAPLSAKSCLAKADVVRLSTGLSRRRRRRCCWVFFLSFSNIMLNSYCCIGLESTREVLLVHARGALPADFPRKGRKYTVVLGRKILKKNLISADYLYVLCGNSLHLGYKENVLYNIYSSCFTPRGCQLGERC